MRTPLTRIVSTSVLLLCALGWSTDAFAEPKDDARRHFRSGLEAVQEEDFDRALQHFLAAQEAFPHPATLYNIAQVYSDLGDFSNALVYYRLYRDEQIDEGVDVDPVIAAIEARSGAGSAPTLPSDEVPIAVADGEKEDLSENERARLNDIKDELAMLSGVFGDRGASNAAANAAAAAGMLENPDVAQADVDLGGLGVGDETLDITEIDLESLGVTAMLEDPYQRSVVTASRVGQDPLDSPSTISVLTSEDIRLSGVTTIPELLRRVTAVDVAQMGGGHADISIRGYNRELNNKVLVLVDGRSTYWDSFGATVWPALPVILEEIERIEIIRGPGSAVYGANAVTGVINIITKTPGEVEETIIHTDFGTVGMRRAAAVTSGQAGAHRFRFAGEFGQHGRWERQYDVSEEELEDPNSPLQAFYDDQDTATEYVKLNGRIDRSFGRLGYASVSAGYSQGFWEYYNLAALPTFGMDFTTHYVRGDISWGDIHFRTFWNSSNSFTGPWMQYDHLRYENYSRIDDDSVDFEVETPTTFTTGAIDHQFNFGLGYRYKRIAFDYLDPDNGSFANPNTQNHFSSFINEQASVGRFDINASFRVDRHPFIPDITQTMSPRLAIIGRVAEYTSIRATAGRAFRAPNALELLSDFELPTPFDGVYAYAPGDTTLLPEKITTFELGLHDESSDYHVLDVVGYVNFLNDAIWLPDIETAVNFWDGDPGGFSAGEVQFSNTDFDYTGYGIEAEGRIFPVDGMDLFLNVDLQDVAYEQEGETLPSFSIPASFKLNTGWMYRTPLRTDITVMAHYTSEQVGNAHAVTPDGIVVSAVDIPARFMLSSRLAVRPTKDENLELAFTGWNLTSDADGWIDHAKGQHLRARYHGSLIYKF